VGEHDDLSPLSILAFSVGGPIRLSGPASPYPSTRPAFGDRERRLRRAHRVSAPGRA